MGYIFESEIESIIHAVRSKTIGEGDTITLREFLNRDVHPAIKAYVRAEVEKGLQQERNLEMRSKKFPYSHPEIVSLQHQIDLLLIQHYQFTREEFDSLLDEAVHFQFNYLCRPQWTMVNFIFGDQRRVSTSTIENKLRYCIGYTYFVDLVSHYIVEHGLAEMTYEEFRALLQKIDREVVSQHTSLELARMTRALFAFVDAGSVASHDQFDQPTLPTNAAVVFFEDKDLTDIKDRLETERDKNSLTQLTISTLATIIEKVRTGNENAAIAADPKPAPSGENGKADQQLAEVEVKSAPTIAEESTSKIHQHIVANHEEPVLEKIRMPGHEKTVVSSPFDDVHTYFSKAERKRFVRSIFKKDEASFQQALENLNSLNSWDKASHFLDSLFLAQGIDPFSKEAVHFTDRVYTRFHPSK